MEKAESDLPIPVTRDGSGKMIKDYSLPGNAGCEMPIEECGIR